MRRAAAAAATAAAEEEEGEEVDRVDVGCVTVRRTTTEMTMNVVSRSTRNSCAVASDTVVAGVSSTGDDGTEEAEVVEVVSIMARNVVVALLLLANDSDCVAMEVAVAVEMALVEVAVLVNR